MRMRTHYLPCNEAKAGMLLAAPVNVVDHGRLRFSLPTGHHLTADNLFQLKAHRAEFIFIEEQDDRSDEQVAADAALAAHRVLDIFAGASLGDPTMAALFDQVLTYRSN